jgi:membrane-bound serine protease (ClpP class)
MMKKSASAVIFLFVAAFALFGDNDSVTAPSAPPSAAGDAAANLASADSADSLLTAAVAKARARIRSRVPANANKHIFVIPAHGAVDHGMAAFIARGVREAERHNAKLIVLDIDTYGGQVDAAFSIIDIISECGRPVAAFARSKAISAGALVAFSADVIAMGPGATIGDVAPLINTNEGPQMLGEKHQSPIRAKFRTLANKNGYPEILAESMVTEDIEVFEIVLPDTVLYLDSARAAALDPATRKKVTSAKLVVRRGELLTMTESEALRYGFSAMTVSDIDEMLRKLGYGNLVDDGWVRTVGKNWSEKFVSIIAMLAPVLMMIGFSALYIEMRSPGFGLPGVIGICCLALVFFGQHMVGLADYTEMLLIVSGLILLAVEIFVLPGFGVAGISGMILIMAGMVLSFQNFVIPSPEFPWQAGILKRNVLRFSLSLLGSIVLIFIFFKYFFEQFGAMVKGPYLAATLGDAQSDNGMSFVPKVGDIGVTSTPLRPSGKVVINKNICDVVTEGQFIENGMAVEVVQIQGNRIVVALSGIGVDGIESAE